MSNRRRVMGDKPSPTREELIDSLELDNEITVDILKDLLVKIGDKNY